MSQLKGNGEPSRNLNAAIGDIYTDEKTGKKYKCTFAYRDEKSKNFECTWKPITLTTFAGKHEPLKPSYGSKKKPEEPKVEEPKVEEQEQEPEEADDKSEAEDKKPANGKTNYAAAFNNKK